MKTSDAGIAAIRLLEALNEATDVFPPLKSAVGGVLHIAKLVKEFRSNKKAWTQFAEHIQKSVALVAQALADQHANSTSRILDDGLKELNNVLNAIQKEIEDIQGLKPSKRFTSFMKDPEKIKDMEKELARAMSLFQLNADIQVSQDVSRIVQDIAKLQESMMLIQASQASQPVATFPELHYAQGATWNPALMCQPGTRKFILKEVMEWIGNFHGNTAARVFSLTGVPGAGKTAISHSIAKLCSDMGWLATAFFFSREDSPRASKLFSTITQDLASRFPSFEGFVNQAIKQDPSLSSAGLTRQFLELILPFSDKFPLDRPIVIVLDAMDEGYSNELLQIFCGDICKLSRVFRIFATSRDVPEVQRLLQSAHVHHRRFDHNEGLGLEDVGMVAQTLLKDISEERGLEGWPTAAMEEKFVQRSEGLMIWVVAICQYLRDAFDPQKDLEELVEKSMPDDHQDAEEQMDKLYVTILEKCRWKDKRFTATYSQVIGTILASKVPLSANAIKALHFGTVEVNVLLRFLKPLFMKIDENQPIQVLHQSLYDLLTIRAHSNEKWSTFAIDEKLHSQQLALCCIKVINSELSGDTPGTGYLKGNERSIPKLSYDAISEHLWYACRFWMSHLQEITNPTPDLIESLQTFLSQRFILWLEATVSRGQFQKMDVFIRWINEMCPQLEHDIYTEDASKSFATIAYHLLYEGRKHEALEAAELGLLLTSSTQFRLGKTFQQCHAYALRSLSNAQLWMEMKRDALSSIKLAVEIYQKLAENDPAAFNYDFAKCLIDLSNSLSKSNLREEAFQSIRKSVAILRQLAEQDAVLYDDHLAWSLRTLSNRFSDLGFREEALSPIKEAIEIYRKLTEKNGGAFNYDLAWCLMDLSERLSKLGLKEKALALIQEALAIFKELARNNPNGLNDDIGWCLVLLSKRLSNLGCTEDALRTIREALSIYRHLEEQSSAGFNHELAWSLGTLSNILSDMGLKQEALSSIKESLSIFKQLDKLAPTAFTDNIAWCLRNLSDRLSDMGLKEEALQSIKESERIFRYLAEECPKAFEPGLARSLGTLSHRLSEMNLTEEALPFLKESVQILEQLAKETPDAFNFDLAKSLVNMSCTLSEIGLKEEALQSVKQAMHIYWPLVEQFPKAMEPELALSMRVFSLILSKLDFSEETVLYAKAVVDHFRPLVSQNIVLFSDDFANSLEILGNVFQNMGNDEEAHKCLEESVLIRRHV